MKTIIHNLIVFGQWSITKVICKIHFNLIILCSCNHYQVAGSAECKELSGSGFYWLSCSLGL